MNACQESCRSILGVLLLLLLQGSHADDPDVHLHKAVGDSLELIANYSKEDLLVQWKYEGNEFAEYEKNKIKMVDQTQVFNGRIKMNEDNVSVTIEDLKLQDSGTFSIVARVDGTTTQYPTKVFELHVHDLIRDVQIESSRSWQGSKNICEFHLQCRASGDPNPSFSWSDPFTTGPNLTINLRPSEKTTVTCTANNTVSNKRANTTLECSEKPDTDDAGSWLKYLLIAVGVGVVAVVVIGGSVAVCCRWRRRTGQGESEAGITVYEDVNTDNVVKKRSDSVMNGMSIYETVDDIKATQKLPQTLYDKINYQRQPAVGASTASSYQEVL